MLAPARRRRGAPQNKVEVCPTRSRAIVSVTQVFSCGLLAQVIMAVVGLVVIHYMDQSEYARFTVALSVVAAASQSLSGGFNRIYLVANKELGRLDCVSDFLGLQILVLGCVLVLSLPALAWLGSLYPFAAAMLVIRCLSDYGQTVFQQELRFVRYGLMALSRAVALLVVLLLLRFFVGGELKAWQILFLETSAFGAVFLVSIGPRLTLRHFLNMPHAWKLAATIMRGKNLFLFGYFSALGVLAQIDIWTLRATTDDLALATYGSAFRYYGFLMLALSTVHVVLLPYVRQARTLAELDTVFGWHRLMLMGFIPLVFFGGWLAQWAIPWIDQGRYPLAVQVFWILAGLSIVSFAMSPYVNMLLCTGDFRFLFGSVVMLLPIHTAGCLGLNAALGVRGVAMATFLTFGILNTLLFLRARASRRHWGALVSSQASEPTVAIS